MSEFDPSTENPFERREPILPDAATDRERELAEKYTRVAPYLVSGVPEATTAWVCIGVQHFQLGVYRDTPEEAGWVCWEMAKALDSILAAERENMKQEGLRP